MFSEVLWTKLADINGGLDTLAACFYIVFRQHGYGRTLDELSSALDIDSSLIGKLQSIITRSFNIQLGPIRPSALIPRIVNDIPMSYEVVECARVLGDNLSIFEGMKPQIVTVVSIVYASIICRRKLDLQQLLDVVNVKLSSVQSFYSQVWLSLHSIIPSPYRSTCHIREIPTKLDKALINQLKRGFTLDFSDKPNMESSATPISSCSETKCSSPCRESTRKRPKSQLFDALSPLRIAGRKRLSE